MDVTDTRGMERYTLRPARSDELPVLVAIDDEASQLYAKAGIKSLSPCAARR